MEHAGERMARLLGLEPLDKEGGWFRRTYTGEAREDGRPCVTAIVALFTAERFSALHRLDAEELFMHQAGDPFEMLCLGGGEGGGERLVLGPEVEKGQRLLRLFEPGQWFGGRPLRGGEHGYSVVSAVVLPGFEWEGFELGKREKLVEAYPEWEDAIVELTRG